MGPIVPSLFFKMSFASADGGGTFGCCEHPMPRTITHTSKIAGCHTNERARPDMRMVLTQAISIVTEDNRLTNRRRQDHRLA